jgi:hypothetical protein
VLRKLHGLGLVALALPAWLQEVKSLSMLLYRCTHTGSR